MIAFVIETNYSNPPLADQVKPY